MHQPDIVTAAQRGHMDVVATACVAAALTAHVAEEPAEWPNQTPQHPAVAEHSPATPTHNGMVSTARPA